MELRALLVEDDLIQLEGLELAFRSIPEIEQRRYGINRVTVEKADCAAIAREKLEEALRSERPFDILMQDLNLPNHSGEKEEGVRVGLDLLEFAHSKKAAKEFCVVSVNTDFDSVSAAYNRCALDFIPKPCEPKDLPKLILRVWERRLRNESARVFEERLKILFPYARREIINQFSSHISNVVNAIEQEVEEMKLSFGERFGLDAQSDSHDPLLEHLAAMKQAVSETMKEWGVTKEAAQDIEEQAQSQEAAPPVEQNEEPVETYIEDILREVVDNASSCLTVKGVTVGVPKGRETRVVSFGRDVRNVLGEIILGGVRDLPDQNNLLKDIFITITVDKTDNDGTEKDGKVEVRFVDNLDPIPDEKAVEINTGASLKPDDGFGRAWGLSVVHHVALRGGGHLNIEPLTQGNVITYFIPLAQNA